MFGGGGLSVRGGCRGIFFLLGFFPPLPPPSEMGGGLSMRSPAGAWERGPAVIPAKVGIHTRPAKKPNLPQSAIHRKK